MSSPPIQLSPPTPTTANPPVTSSSLPLPDFSHLVSSSSPAVRYSSRSVVSRSSVIIPSGSSGASLNPSEIFLVPASASAFNSSATALNKFAASPAHQSQNLNQNFQGLANSSSAASKLVSSPSLSPHDSLSTLFSPLISLFKPSSSFDSIPNEDSEAYFHSQLKREWSELLQNWRSELKASKKVQLLVWKGIPPSIREEAWQKIIANDLNITKDLYRIFQVKSMEIREKESQSRENGEFTKSDSALAIIDKDIPRTFPELKFFHEEGSPVQESLRNILSTYSCYRPDTGYVQGMSYLAAMCLLNMEEYPAFVCLANVLNSPLHFKFFTMSVHDMNAHLLVYQHFFKLYLPSVYQHFQEINLRPDMYLFDWLMTIFTRCLPLEVAFRVWDNFLILGHAFLFRTALGIVKSYGEQLDHQPFERCMELLLRPKNTIEEGTLFANIAKIDITTSKMDKLISERMKEQMQQEMNENGGSGSLGNSPNGILNVLQ
jgi:hypothetical protein